ncbi:hypothetical protein [Nostoc sp. FACHB-145]|uniref:hypothetical protein n=1 Tax=Nostoc sp. FACHB-145 TaxID=2692836 RepID=UPI0016838571|nr:hypothetical protein [Nostoc sp. FACHB-145]MBD2468791.1 hypothetical protein [Nostoc sp. FACHB-145]
MPLQFLSFVIKNCKLVIITHHLPFSAIVQLCLGRSLLVVGLGHKKFSFTKYLESFEWE